MRTRLRDWIWAAAAAVLAGVIAWWLVVAVARSLSEIEGVADAAVFLVLLLLSAVVAWWLVMGAWRRTKWGAPPGGSREAAEVRLTGQQPAGRP